MAFWLHKSRAALLVRGISVRHKFIIIFSIPIVIFLLWFSLIHLPQRHILEAIGAQKISLLQEKSRLEQRMVRYDQIVARHSELQTTLHAYKFLHVSSEEIIDLLLNYLRLADCGYRDIHHLSSVVHDGFVEHRITLDCSGTFNGVCNFFDYLKKLPTPLRTEAMVIEGIESRMVHITATLGIVVARDSHAAASVASLFESKQVHHITTLRDPFAPLGAAQPSKQAIVLEGIVFGDHKEAILAANGQREVIQQGQTFNGYCVVSIEKDCVVLTQGKAKKKLTIE